ncbi:MAG TPA: methylenetetrahydrofolate reductase [Actinomycetota bacterium]
MSGEPPRSHLHRLLASGAFVVTAELQATDSPDPESVYRLADLLRGSVDAVNCTDNSAAHPHISPLASAHLLLDRGVEPIVQLACRDRNRLALQADLLGAVALGARNVCLMTGDDVTAGDHPEAKPIYDIDAVHAIHIARGMRDQGVYVSGRNLDQPLPLFIGAVENPFAPPRDFRPIRLGKKVEAGAEFVQTQIVFNLATMRMFMARCEELGLLDRVFILASVYVCRSARSARYLRDMVPGIDVPDAIIDRMEGVPSDRQTDEGIRIGLEIVDELREMRGVAGVHLISIRGDEAIVRLVEEAGLLPRPAAVEAAPAG